MNRESSLIAVAGLEFALWLAFAPPAAVSPSAFAEANLKLPASSNAQSGPLALKAHHTYWSLE